MSKENKLLLLLLLSMQLEGLYKDLGILKVSEMVKLENCKTWFKFCKGMLPTKLQSIMAVGSSHETLVKIHNYNTCRKVELNSPKASSLGYRNSFLIKGLIDFGSLP